MVRDSDHTETEKTIHQFEKNRFFDGKLMTARDMQAEQQYHAERLELVTGETTGSGIVRGLEIRALESTDGELAISVGSGLAIDGAGRPIVIETPTTKSVPAPDSEECYLFVRFDEVALGSVPAPDGDTPAAETESNRLVEVFELTYRETPPERGVVQDIDITADIMDTDPATAGSRIATGYHEANRTTEDDREETAVYLGGFEQQADGTWVPSETAPQPEYVYDHDLLYATLIEHITDTENPHQTEVEAEPPEPDLDPEELGGIHERVDYLQSELVDLKARQQTASSHLQRKTFNTTARLFRSTAETFTDHSGSVSKAAHEIAQQAEAASHAEQYTNDEQYLTVVRELHPSLVEFGDQLTDTASESSADRYLDAVADLQSALEANRPAVEVAIALDGVAETAADLDVLYTAAETV